MYGESEVLVIYFNILIQYSKVKMFFDKVVGG